jgi:hypothetical protein
MTTLRGDRPSPIALVTQAWTVDAMMSAIARGPKKGKKCLSRYERYPRGC